MRVAKSACRIFPARRCARSRRCACTSGSSHCWLEATLLWNSIPRLECRCGAARRWPCSSVRRRLRSSARCTRGPGTRMSIGLTHSEQKKSDAASKPANNELGSSMPGRVAGQSSKLSALLNGVEGSVPAGGVDLEIRQVTCDSRKVQPRALFFALHGAKADGNAFIRDAVSRGAVAIASEDAAPATMPSSVAWIRVAHARKALAITAANYFGHPAEALQLVAVTGTNGKTTTTSLVDTIIKASGAKTGLFGTIAYHTPLGDYPAPNTTPESVDLQGFFAEIRDAGGKYAVLEASSHSLMMDRLWGCHFQAAVFTNLTHEHMDFHKTFEDYFAAKRRLFEGTGAGPAEVAILNADDEYGPRLSGIAKASVTYGIENAADIGTKKFLLNFSGLSFTAHTPNGKLQITSSLVGRINVYNILAAIGAAQALSLSNETIEAGIKNLGSVSGRFQLIGLGQPFLVIVDYAHTDDALQNLIRTARELNPKGRVITLFGCGGGKDRTKRPVMGEVAGRLSD